MKILELHKQIQQVAPIAGVSSTKRIDFLPEATEEEKAAAQAIADNWQDPADPQWKTFGEQIAIAPAYLRNTTHNNITLGVKSTLELMLKISADGDLRIESIRDLWNAIAAESSPSTEEIGAINEIIKSNAIDQFFALQSDGNMVINAN